MSFDKEDIQILKKDIEIDKDDVLGRGGFGHVFAANLSNGTKVAVKMLIDNGHIPERNQKELRREACRLKELGHHCSVIDLHGILFEKDNFGLVLEYMHFGSSSEFVKKYQRVDLPLLLRMTCQVASAMLYLHSYNPPILHLDLKADNVLIDKFFNAKISDFGLSEWRTVSKMLTKGGSEAARRCTITHIAPEVLRDVNHRSTDKLDIYAFGITVWEFFAAKRPYENKSENIIRQAVCNGQRPDIPSLPEDCPMIIKLMINKCWNNDPNVRPAFKAIFPEMEKTFDDHKDKIIQAQKSLRQKICENHNVNDPEYMDTEYIDDLLEATETDSVPMETETGNDTKPEIMETETTEENDKQVLKKSPALVYKPRLKELTDEEQQLRRVLRDPVAFEIVQSEACDNIPLSSDMREILRDPEKLREYINNDPELRYELLRLGSPVLSKLRTPNVRSNTAQGKCEQKLADKFKKLDASYRVKRTKIDMNELNADEKRHVGRARGLKNCSYSQKLYNKGLGLNLLKVLKEPRKLENALKSYQANKSGGQQKFEMVDRRTVEAAQDPFLLQILLTQDYGLLDGLMSQYPNLMMDLISANMTTYRPSSQPSSSARVFSARMPNQNNRGVMEEGNPSTHQQMGAIGHDLTENPTQPLRNVAMGDNIKMEGGGKENRTQKGAKDDNKAENERKIKQILEEAKRKSEQEKRKKEREARKVFEQDQKRKEEERKNEEKKKMQEEERRKLMEKEKELRPEQGLGGQGGYLGSLYGVFRGSHNASLFQSNTQRMRIPEQLASLQSMDKLSMEVDELSNYAGPPLSQPPARGHANPLAPRHEASPYPPVLTPGTSPVPASQPQAREHANPLAPRPDASPYPPVPRPEAIPAPPSPSVKPEPTSYPANRTGNSPKHSPTNSSSSFSQRNSNSTKESGAPPTKQTPPSGGATGVGGARGQSGNIIISHKHAGGGFSQITINQDAPNQPNIQVGNQNLMVIGGDSDSDGPERKVEDSKKKKRRHREIKLPDQRLDMDRLDIVCTGIGKHWKRLCRELGMEEVSIEQIEQDYHINGTYEIMYQALQRWIQKNGKTATIKALGQHLSNIDRDDLMKKLK